MSSLQFEQFKMNVAFCNFTRSFCISPVSISIHNFSSPRGMFINHSDCPFKCFPGFSHNAVTNLKSNSIAKFLQNLHNGKAFPAIFYWIISDIRVDVCYLGKILEWEWDLFLSYKVRSHFIDILTHKPPYRASFLRSLLTCSQKLRWR